MLCYENWHKTDGLKQNGSKFNCYGLNKWAKKTKIKYVLQHNCITLLCRNV